MIHVWAVCLWLFDVGVEDRWFRLSSTNQPSPTQTLELLEQQEAEQPQMGGFGKKARRAHTQPPLLALTCALLRACAPARPLLHPQAKC